MTSLKWHMGLAGADVALVAVIGLVPEPTIRNLVSDLGATALVNWVPMLLILSNFGPVKRTAKELASLWLRSSNTVGPDASEPPSISAA